MPLLAAVEREDDEVVSSVAEVVLGVHISRTATGCGVPNGFLAVVRGFFCWRGPMPEHK